MDACQNRVSASLESLLHTVLNIRKTEWTIWSLQDVRTRIAQSSHILHIQGTSHQDAQVMPWKEWSMSKLVGAICVKCRRHLLILDNQQIDAQSTLSLRWKMSKKETRDVQTRAAALQPLLVCWTIHVQPNAHDTNSQACATSSTQDVPAVT